MKRDMRFVVLVSNVAGCGWHWRGEIGYLVGGEAVMWENSGF